MNRNYLKYSLAVLFKKKIKKKIDKTLCFAHPPSTEFYTLVCNLTHTDCATGMIEIMFLLFFSDQMYKFHLVGSKTLHFVHKHGSV